jgi:mRNA-degrading endonuclease toxin of MazEF toxin-antitoxin module
MKRGEVWQVAFDPTLGEEIRVEPLRRRSGQAQQGTAGAEVGVAEARDTVPVLTNHGLSVTSTVSANTVSRV